MFKCWKNFAPLNGTIDDRRIVIIPGNFEETLQFCAKQFIDIGKQAIQEKDFFAVALSGGKTPLAIYETLANDYKTSLDWSKTLLFWSDERAVPPDHVESNYHNALQSGLSSLGIHPENIFRMQAENDIEHNAQAYEDLIKEKLISSPFDLVMLGVGDDGHTASLFPHHLALHEEKHLVIAVKTKNGWRMTLTYTGIHLAKFICIYALGPSKAKIVEKVFHRPYDPDTLPVQKIGSPKHQALWILDNAASELLI